MAFDSLRLFRDMVHTRSLSRAAQLHGITASAASQALQEWERNLAVTLLDRSTRPLTVTSAGKLYDDLCRDVLRRHDHFLAELGDIRTSTCCWNVRIAAIYSVGLSDMNRLETLLAERLPEARLQVTYRHPGKVYQAVQEDQADLGIVRYTVYTSDHVVLPWREETMLVTMPPSHALASRSEVLPSDLDGYEMVGFDEELPIRRDIDRYLREHGAAVRMTLSFDNLQSIKEAVAFGAGVAIVPAPVIAPELSAGRLAAVPLRPLLVRPVGLVYRKRKPLPRAVAVTLELLQSDALL